MLNFKNAFNFVLKDILNHFKENLFVFKSSYGIKQKYRRLETLLICCYIIAKQMNSTFRKTYLG